MNFITITLAFIFFCGGNFLQYNQAKQTILPATCADNKVLVDSKDFASSIYAKGDSTPLAKLYPHDNGIEKDPAVLYVEKFDDGMQKILSRYTDIKNGE